MSRLAEALRRASEHAAAPRDANGVSVSSLENDTPVPEPALTFAVEHAASESSSAPAGADTSAAVPAFLLPIATDQQAADPVHEHVSHAWFENVTLTQVHDRRSASAALPRFAARLRQKLVSDPKTLPGAVEQYRRLAAALHHSQLQFGTKVTMVASAMQGEGKSLSASNLALTLSHSYRRRVLLIDADLRRPSLQEIFQLPVTNGLSEALRGMVEQPLPLFEVSPRLTVLPSGRPDQDPIGGLASERMTRLIGEAASVFDWVLIDTPPLALVPDAKVLGAMVDAVVLVILAGKSPCELVRQAVEALGPEKVFGVVLNGAELDRSGYKNQYGYYGSAGH
jgi:protein-tyrosine kinase